MGNDVEEGEISDAASVEITEEVLNDNKEVKIVTDSKPKGEAARVWTMRDLCNKYPSMCRGYAASGLYNFAWAQAVQNKPLKDIFGMEGDQDDKKSSPSSSVNSGKDSKEEKKEVDGAVMDESGDDVNAEKEEGELEEGEIDLDSESTERVGEESEQTNSINGDSIDEVLKTKMCSIQEALERLLNVVDVDKSFQEVCLKLQNTLDILREVVLDNNVTMKDALIQLLFSAIKAVNGVFCSMNNALKEQNRGIFSRLLFHVKSYGPSLFSPDYIKEIDAMASSVGSPDGMNEKNPNAVAANVGHAFNSSNKSLPPVESLMNNKSSMSTEVFRQGLSGFRSKGALLPLLDLHKDHDVDSLPSPTREITPCIPARRMHLVVDNMARTGSVTGKVANETEDPKKSYYETDALRAVSSYQQKFARGSFFSNNNLPSPTPSEESGDGEGDIAGEVSSSSVVSNPKLVSQPIFRQQVVSQHMDISNMQGFSNSRDCTPASSGSNSTPKASAKSRDPRLRFSSSDLPPTVNNAPKLNPTGDITNTRKQKPTEEPVIDGPALKRSRNGLDFSRVIRDVKTVPGTSGWSVGTNVVDPRAMSRSQSVETSGSDPRNLDNGAFGPNTTTGIPNMAVSGNESVAVTVPDVRASLPDLLKDFAQNPAMLINLLKMGQQQRSAAETQKRSTNPVTSTMLPTANAVLGAVPLVNVAPSLSTGIVPKPVGAPQVPSQAMPMDELGKIRMKPRDPRRILHETMLQRSSGGMGPEQLKTNVPSTPTYQAIKDNVIFQKQLVLPENPIHSQSVPPPDIARQFTKNLKNIASMVSVSQASTNQPLVSVNPTSQSGQTRSDRVDGKAVASNNENQRVGAGSAPEVVGQARPLPQNAWGDVEHLFEGYDDQQKAAIQRERSRRMEEQKKMFSAQKLCLVLDLDHTLLNSAKFVEVDPVHDEILRKKEEQDREKPQRHLFRFPHMGMWTKLRPGIWTFLERASKLFELHLYTMGNKLYATEMAKVLDPKGVLFSGRVISRGDDGDNFDKSKDLEGVLGMESAVVIIDDSVRVWPHNKLNLIVVERYTYFPCSRRQFGLLGPSLLEIDHDERPEDGTLASSLAVIERIHQNFFSRQSYDDVDVRNILAEEQRKILAGCRIVFSRVFPVGEANPHHHPLWQTAEQFGAVCLKQIDDQVTHVVANSLGTDKVNWALSNGKFVVYPGWVEASALLYRRANELDFAIKP